MFSICIYLAWLKPILKTIQTLVPSYITCNHSYTAHTDIEHEKLNIARIEEDRIQILANSKYDDDEDDGDSRNTQMTDASQLVSSDDPFNEFDVCQLENDLPRIGDDTNN